MKRDADEVVGYVRPYRTPAHSYSSELRPPKPRPEPVRRWFGMEVGTRHEVREIVSAFAVWALVLMAFWMWVAIGSASQVTP